VILRQRDEAAASLRGRTPLQSRAMARIAKDLTWLIGRTPLVALQKLSPDGGGRVVAKLECLSPGGSNKDRGVLGMIRLLERQGTLQPGGTIVEASAGDTGLAVAMLAARLGYRLVLSLPACPSDSRCNLLRALGAELEFTDPALGISGALARAEELSKVIPGAVVLQPFSNRGNVEAHRDTAREIWEDTDGEVKAVVCPVGTGGTAAGCVAFFRSICAPVAVIGVEPAASAVLRGEPSAAHDIPGLGAGFVPEILPLRALAEVVAVTEAAAAAAVQRLAREEGLLLGPASGAVLHAALEVARRPACAGDMVVAILPDSGERYEEHAVYARPAAAAR
jgi:cysteine synthase A